MFTIRSAAEFSDSALCEAMNRAFSDYAVSMQLSEAAFSQMMRQRGLDRGASHVCVMEGEIAGIWLISVRDNSGYLISSGTSPRFRGRGIARQLANASLDHMRKARVLSFQTEVMNGNDIAAGLYLSLGMSTRRALSCYALIAMPELGAAQGLAPRTVRWAKIAASVPDLRGWEPSWQNSDSSLSAIEDKIVCAAMEDESGLAAYAAMIVQSRTLAQIAVRPDLRRRGLGTTLVKRLFACDASKPMRVINVQEDDDTFAGFMTGLAAEPTLGQRELFMTL